TAERVVHLRRQLPGNHQGADRGGSGRHGRHVGRPERERDPGPPDSGRYGVLAAPKPEDQATGGNPGRDRNRAPHPAGHGSSGSSGEPTSIASSMQPAASERKRSASPRLNMTSPDLISPPRPSSDCIVKLHRASSS